MINLNILSEISSVMADYYQLLVQWVPKLVAAILIFLLFWLIASRVGKFAFQRLNLRMDDPLLARFLARVSKWVIITLGFILALETMGLGDIAGGLVAGAGVSAFIIGFAFKDIGENFLAGILLAFNRPFRVGHIIEVGDIRGSVVALDLRITQVKTFDGKDVFLPNSSLIKGPLINYTIDGFLRQDFTIGIDYQSDISSAIKIILEAIAKVPGILMEEKKPSVAVANLGSSSIALQVFYWLDTFDKTFSGIEIKKEAISRTLTALSERKIYTPGDILELKNYYDQNIRVAN